MVRDQSKLRQPFTTVTKAQQDGRVLRRCTCKATSELKVVRESDNFILEAPTTAVGLLRHIDIFGAPATAVFWQDDSLWEAFQRFCA